MRNADWPQVLHGGSENALLDVLVPLELDLADLDLRSFFDHEGDTDGGRRDLTHFGFDRGELASVLGKQILDGNFRFLYACGVILTLNDEADLVLLEAVEHVAIGDRTQAKVVDFPDRLLFLHLDDDPPALRSLLTQELYVLEVAGIPEGIEVAFER